MVNYVGPEPPPADRYVAAASDDGVNYTVVGPLTVFGLATPLGLSTGVLWYVKISLWVDATTTQVSDWSVPNTITPA